LFSNPVLANNLFWQNRSFYIGVGALNPTYQQNIVTLLNRTGTALVSQTATGQCVTGSSYWDLGVRGDSAPATHSVVLGGVTLQLAPTYSLLTNSAESGTGTNNIQFNPNFVSQYCNGARTPPEFKASTFNVPPGISDATVPNPIFNLTPAATVDEGNNWINMTWGPLSLVNPVTNAQLANYALASPSAAIDYVPVASTHPSTDFFGNPRPDPANPNSFDIGAIEFQGNNPAGPAITQQPTNQTVTLGNSATFSVVATGTPTLTYRWQFLAGANWVNVGALTGTGSTTPTLTTVATTAGLNGLQFRVVVTDGIGRTTTSNTVTLTVGNAAPVITKQPTNQTVTLGNTAIFGVTATGNAPLTYRWQFLVGTNWVNVGAFSGTGYTTATLTTVATTAGLNGLQFRVIVTDGNNLTTTSNAVTLTVSNAHPVITVQPTSQTVTHPAKATFSVTATGNAPLTYQWQFLVGANWVNVGALTGTGYTTATLTTVATTAGMNGLQFRVIVTDGNNLTTTSNTVALTVN
jgi:hypothetical protein